MRERGEKKAARQSPPPWRVLCMCVDTPLKNREKTNVHMRFFFRLLPMFGALLLCLPCHAGDEDIAIAIVYDTSGSMRSPVKDAAGKMTPKYEIANRAIGTIVTQLEKFTASSGKKVQVGLYTFALQGAKVAVPIGPFEPPKFRDWLAKFNNPEGATPLGNATAEAAKALLALKAGPRHLLVVTDGENTIGPPPEKLMPALFAQAVKAGNSLNFHFVAFDVNAAIFAAVKKEGATLVSAADEKQLNERLTFVLEEKILLEKE